MPSVDESRTATPHPPKLEVRGLSLSWDGRPIVADVGFTVRSGQLACLVGRSGTGKTTLFHAIAGLTQPDSGQVLLDGRDVTGQPGRISYMLQKDLLLPEQRVVDNVALPLRLAGVPKREARDRARQRFAEFGLAGTERLYPSQLSGGMRQRAALLRTLLTSKEVLLLDEPFGALDAITRLQLQLLLTDIWQEMRKTVLFVTHDVDEALLLSDEILLLTARPGRVLKRYQVDMPRPRLPSMLADPPIAAMKADMMKLLWKEVHGHEIQR